MTTTLYDPIGDSTDRRACDECGRVWTGSLPHESAVHIWLCPWCETRASGRSVLWMQQPDDTWLLTKDEFDREEWPWRGPLRVVRRDTERGAT